MNKISIKGFTVIELMILVAIIGMLAVISVPHFISAFKRAKQAEAKHNLGQIFALQMAYFGDNNEYAGGFGGFTYLNWSPEGPTFYSYFIAWQEIEATAGGRGCIGHTPMDVYSDESSFTAGASGNIDEDYTCDQWTINDGKDLRNVQIDL